MSEIFQTGYSNHHKDYLFKLEWNDEAFVSGDISFKIFIEAQNRKTKFKDSIEIQVSITEDENGEGLLNIYARGEIAISVPLDEIYAAEEIIERLPSSVYGVGDPITGCLIRSGLSVTIGQLINCKNSTSGKSWFQERIRSLGICLKQSFPKMCTRLAFRITKCIIKMDL